MPGRAGVSVTTTAANLLTAASLTAGETYIAQNTGARLVEHVNYATDPTDEAVSWFVLEPGDYIRFEADAANPVWVRTSSQASELTIGDG